MKLRKSLAILASALMLTCVGCKKSETKKNNTDVTIDENDPYTSNLEIKDYDGYNFRILIRPSNIKDQYLEEGTGDPIEDAIYKRNLMVESMYNIKISATPSSHSNYETDALNSILAGDDASPFSSFPVSVGHRLFCLSLLLGKPLEERVIAYAGDFG